MFFLFLTYPLWCWWYSVDGVNIFWICYWFLFLCFYFSCFILWHWYHLLLIVDLWISYFISIRILSATFTVFNVVFRGQCFCALLFVVDNFFWYFWLLFFHICSIFFSEGLYSLLYLWYFCVYWFIWVKYDFDGWMFVWLIILCLLLMFLISLYLFLLLMLLIYTLSPYLLKSLYFFDATSLHLTRII